MTVEKPEKKETVPISALFRYATAWDKFLMFGGSLAAIASGVALPLMTVVFADIIQAFIEYPIFRDNDRLMKMVIPSVIYLCIIGGGVWAACYIQMCLWMISGENQAKKIREEFFRALLKKDICWFDQNETGDLTSRLIGDTALIQEGISEKIGLAIQYIVTFLAGFVIAYTRGWKLALVLTAVLPVIGGAAAFMVYLLSKKSGDGQDAYAGASSVAQQVISAIRTVNAFNGQERECARYEKKLDEAEKVGVKKALVSAAGLGTVFCIIFGTYGLAFWSGSIFVVQGDMNGGQVLNVLFSIIIGAFSLGSASPGIQALAIGRGAAKKIFETIDRQSKVDALSEAGNKPDCFKNDIIFKNIDFHYPQRPDVPILKNFSLVAKSGKTTALVGASGSGKSTIVKLLERFYDPSNGSVSFGSENIKDMNVKWLRQHIGFVGQEPVLFDATIRQNIIYGLKDSDIPEKELDRRIEEACQLSNAWDFIQKLPKKLETSVGEAGAMLSGGQKQRIAIARAIIADPPILLLDEATSALDTESERLVQAALDKAAHGRTTIVIAHRLSTIKNAENIVVLDRGSIVQMGTHDELLSNGGAYAELVSAQALRTAIREPQLDENTKFNPVEKAKVLSPNQSPDVTLEISGEKDEKKTERTVDFKRVMKMSKPEVHFLVLGTLGAGVNGVLMPLFSLIFSSMLAVFSETDNTILRQKADFWSLMFLILAIAAFLCNFMQIASFVISGEKLTRRVRSRCFRAIMTQEIGFFDEEEHSSGVLVSRLADDANQVQGLTGQMLGSIIQNVATFTAGLTIAFVNGWELTLVVLSFVPLIGLGGALQFKTLAGIGGKAKKAYDSAGQIACEVILNIRTVASLSKEEHFLKVYTKNIELPHKVTLKAAYVSSIGFGFSQGIMFFAYAVAFYYGAVLISQGKYTAEAIMKVIFAIIFTSMAAGQASTFAPNLAKSKIATISIFDLIDREPRMKTDKTSGKIYDQSKGQVSGKDIKFSYPARPDIVVLKGLSVFAKPGETIALVGPSGSGKSTIVGLLERFYDIQSGSVTFDGTNVSELNLPWLRSQMALVGQEPVLFNLSIRENIAYGMPSGQATNEQIEAAARMANIHDFIMSLPSGYDTLVGEKGGQLSGGQKQRVAIARALINNPKLLLLDEATSALDSESEKVVQEALDGASKGRTTIVIAHRLSTIQNADRIFVIKDGAVKEQGRHEELIAERGLYFELVNQQSLAAKH